MVNSTEALKLALDALKEAQTNDDGMEKWDRNKKAIAAIEEALAQPEEAQSALSLFQSGFIDGREKGLKEALAQRTWVGLTSEEIKLMDARLTSNSSFYAGALWAEAKLKEKNGA